MFRFTMLIILWGVSLLSAAASGGWSNHSEVTLIYPNISDETIYIQFSNMINPDECTKSSKISLKKEDNFFFDESFSILLAAYAAGKKVKYYVGGCDTAGYPQLDHLWLEQP